MINSTRMIGLIMTAALGVSVAAGQQLPVGEWDAETPDLSWPAEAEPLPAPSSAAPADANLLLDGSALPVDQPFDGYKHQEFVKGGLEGLWHPVPAPIESTSTWLRRGFWYAEADAVIWNRKWNRDPLWLAAEDQQVEFPDFFINPQRRLQFFSTNRIMILQGAHPGEDASVRGTLGHFLFRDSHNRDHNLEFTTIGGGDWHQRRAVGSEQPQGLFVPFHIDGGNRSFDESSRQEADYSSNFASIELNYIVRGRHRRDQMIMDANGHWHRAAQHGFFREFLVGLRAMESKDFLDWRAEDIGAVGNDGQYLIRTDNDMIGFQMGTAITFETSRWSLGAHTKGGVFLNDATGRTMLNFTADDTSDADLRMKEDELSFVGEFRFLGRWHVTPNFSLRAAYEMMYLTSQALAPNQATFITDFHYLNTTQDPFFHGASFGFEGYW